MSANPQAPARVIPFITRPSAPEKEHLNLAFDVILQIIDRLDDRCLIDEVQKAIHAHDDFHAVRYRRRYQPLRLNLK